MWISLNIARQNTQIRGGAYDNDGEGFLRMEPIG